MHFPTWHVVNYAHMLDFGLCFLLDPFIVKIFQAWNICLSQLTPLGLRNLIVHVWTIRYKKFPEPLTCFANCIGSRKTTQRKKRGVGRERDRGAMRILARVDGCPCTPRVVS